MRVLVAPMDWGLGHATRSIPLIRELLKYNCNIIIAAEGASKLLLQQEFPELHFLFLKGYRMRYSRKRFWLPLRILLQFPKILFSIYAEHRWLKKAIKENCFDVVFSDNRFGLYHSAVPCIYITHQLTIKTGNRFTEWLAQKVHYHFINKYSYCWVPDAAGQNNFAGELSHPTQLPKTPVQYIGPLSRFEKNDLEKIYDLAIILSGPEPQRSIFEKQVLKELENYTGPCLLLRGLPGDLPPFKYENKQIEIHNHFPGAVLNNIIQQSKLVITRSGYTSVMDLVKLQQKAVLIPTPGQTEQEYLAKYLGQKKYFYCTNQNNFNLLNTIRGVDDFPFIPPDAQHDEYKTVVKSFIDKFHNSIG